MHRDHIKGRNRVDRFNIPGGWPVLLNYLLRRNFTQLAHDAMAIHRGCEKCRRSADSVFEEHDAKIAAVERRGADAKRMEMGSQRRS
jgi:hypothetical protein